MMTATLSVLAAGSLKRALLPLTASFAQTTGLTVDIDFGPAGLLRERIEAGERCSLFASANTAHPQALLRQGKALSAQTFAFNRLNLTAHRLADAPPRDWLALLADPALRLATSTPGSDPSGDYTWQLFDNIEARHPGLGAALKHRALPLVGGRDTLTVPAAEVASAWIIRSGRAELFIGYAHYSRALAGAGDLQILSIPAPYNPLCEYQMALLDDNEPTRRLAQYIVSAAGQSVLRQMGFLTLEAE
ncbi:substrate-binding domain-containing protein [[Enterobacter] lignolyticus]|uniref:Molybdate ABC transporter substrate-binding protein n=1 Tax=[Enterobacter] lignolyticus TaxID=1334193 RepID=A0A806X5B0_9ENTR|nr:substrate-binding domain-containing protein [[Enterobacter] lignolyticus]ALR76904.1 molybdate ABC transporter substrate-binding protein [[Enterobacter] lignolyticus]